MKMAQPYAVPIRLLARDGEETTAMQAALKAFRTVRERQRRAGATRVSEATKAAHAEVQSRLSEVFNDLIETEAQTAYLRLMQKAISDVPDDARSAERVWGLNALIATIYFAGGSNFAQDVDVAHLATGGRIHPNLIAVSELVDSISAELPRYFPRADVASGAPLLAAVKMLRSLLTEETADAVTIAPGLGMSDLLDAIIRDVTPEAIEVLRWGVLIPELEHEARRLRLDLQRLKAEDDHLASHDIRTTRWTMTPLASFGTTLPERLKSDRDFLDALLYVFRKIQTGDSRAAGELSSVLMLVAVHPALLRWWLPRVFIPDDDFTFGAAHRRVIEALVCNPRRFLRLNSDPDALPYRRHLRPLLPLFDGYHPTIEQTALLEALRAPDSALSHILDLMVPYLQGRIETQLTPEVAECLVRSTDRLLDELADAIEGTVLVGEFVHLRNADDVAFSRLLEDEAAAATEAVPAVPEPFSWKPEFETTTAAEIATPIVFEMVEKLGSAQMRSTGLTTTRHTLVDDLSHFIAREGADIEPPRSVARAIYHYLFEIPDTVRNTWNKESLNGFSWHKLKRGRCRIYIRHVGETVCFCLINRRDWVHSDAIGRRF